MRHAKIHKLAVFLDSAIDAYKKARGRKSFPHEVVKQLVPLLSYGPRVRLRAMPRLEQMERAAKQD